MEYKSDNTCCVDCNSTKLFHDKINATIVCTDCGDIQPTMFDENPEWSHDINESNKKNPSRCGFPVNPLLEKSSLSTVIKGNSCNFMKKLHNQISMDHIERSRFHVFEYINRLADDSGNLSQNVTDKAKYYYKILSERKLSRGSIRQGLIGCCIMYGCISENVSRSVKEIAQICEIDPCILNKTKKLFVNIMKDILQNEDILNTTLNITNMIPRFCQHLNLNKVIKQKIILKMNKLYNYIEDLNCCEGKTPASIICGMAIYICKINHLVIDKCSFVKLNNISIVTVNKVFKIINDLNLNNTFYMI